MFILTLRTVTGFLCITELYNSFAPEVKRRIAADLDGLGETTRSKYMQYGLIPLLRFANKKNLDLSMNTLLEFSRELQLNGKGAGLVSSAFNGLRTLMNGVGMELKWEERNAYLLRFTRHKKAFDSRSSRKWAYPMNEKDIIHLAKYPPKGCQPQTWCRFLFIGWTFLLRKSEITRVCPSDLSCTRDKKGKITDISLLVRNNKNSVNKKEAKKVTFPKKLIPDKVFKQMEIICNNNEWDWSELPHENIILPHLKTLMEGRYDMDYYYVVIHCLRHGRAENLHDVYKIKDNKMLRLGRWSTTAGRNAYKHS